MTLQTDLETAVLAVQSDSQILHNIIHGDAQSTITINSGEIKTISKVVADIEATATQQIETLNIGSAALQSAVDTATEEANNSASSANQAATLVSSAQQVFESVPFRDVVFLTIANSPFDVDSTYNGVMFAVDTSGGDIIINLPLISDTDLPFNVTVKKKTNDPNAVFITADAADHINENTDPYAVSAVGGASFIADTDTSPDTWITSSFGASAGEAKKQLFKRSEGDFTTGDTDLTVTNIPLPPSSAALTMTIDGVTQHSEAFSYEPSTGVTTFPALGAHVNEIEFAWDSSGLSIGVPADETVGYTKIASGLRGALADIVAGITTKFATCKAVLDYMNSPGRVIQIVSKKSNVKEETALQIPFDNTIPQKTEGKEYMVVDFIPHFANSKILIEISIPVMDSSGNYFMSALFKDDEADALASCIHTLYTTTYTSHINFIAELPAENIVLRTYKLHYGVPQTGGTAYILKSPASNGAMFHGDAPAVVFKITEIAQ
jgi:hypothetical protein